ncbi:hypothetical protein ACFWGI_37775 [Streptomyces niveus]|uniref:hypothetical protein n=1 Tax=Streptomyces niveus TaxID=193462 RepID=UPI003668B31C
MTTRPEVAAAVPADCREAVGELTGSPAAWERWTDRNGVAVWKVSGPSGTWAVKAGRNEGAAVVGRESAVMRRIDGTVAVASFGGRARCGRSVSTAWLLTPWLEGPSTWDAFQEVRDKRGNYETPLQAAVDLCTAVGQLHQAGWVHGDLQPHHAIHTPDGVRLIDCSWSSHVTMPPSTAHEGGMVHFMSPELMLRIESGERPVATSQTDEVYTLASSLWWAASNRWPLDYRAVGIDPATFPAIELRRLRLRHRIPLTSMTHWPELGDVLGQVLTTHPAQRPTAVQLAQRLHSIGTG